MSTPKEDAERLMNELLPLAKDMLYEAGEFYPYGGFMRLDGSIVHVGAKSEFTDYPKSNELIELLFMRLKNHAREGGVIATIIIFDVKIKPPGKLEKMDAIQVIIDHQSGYSAEVFFPYIIQPEGALEFEKIFAQRGSNRIYGHPE